MLTAATSVLVPQFLMVYSPRFNAQTIRVHIERLRTAGFAWWGRFSGDGERFDETGARARWPHVAKLADARAASSEPSLLFVTNYVDLHVFKVTAVLFGESPGGRVRKEALSYYEKRQVPLWFRIEDARGLSYDQSTTNDWFERRLGVVRQGALRASGKPYARPYDSTAAVHYQFPIVVDAPAHAELFTRDRPPAPVTRWADTTDAISSRPVQRAREHLEAHLEDGLWACLTPETRDLLANGWVERGRMQHDQDVDPAMGFTRIANAVETELCVELCGELQRLSTRLKGARDPFAEALAEELSASRGRDSRGGPVPWSLGSSLELLRRLASHHRRALERPGQHALVSLCTSLGPIESIKRLRDPASHGGSSALWPALRGAVVGFYADRGVVLARVVDAREGVKRRGGSGRSTGEKAPLAPSPA